MKKLIIVCEEKCRVYGDYLSQLISLDDDTGEGQVGTKDGEVVAQVWLENDYKANAPKISSDQYLLFIGYDKLIKEKSSHMKVEFSQYGMKYGWLGKQAVLCVEQAVSLSEYDRFIDYAKAYQDDVKKLIEQKKENRTISAPEKTATAAVAVAGLAILPPIAAVAVVPIAGISVVKKFALNKKIVAQQYSCEIMKFYLDSLSSFLGL